eukprot:TRINITY_DN11688_c0_g1_i2.p1 TRINITY_DN11688_c0_g1~~TRINITY_DN11688_c0_g1_i2.p1  ORF type:complete len:243 (+),score=59.75 TRINITY_DN11688_c0_g1_i2:47-730(+)
MCIRDRKKKTVRMKQIIVVVLLASLAMAHSHSSKVVYEKHENEDPLPVVKNLDIDKVMGHWYTVAALPHLITRLCSCIETNYTLNDMEDVISKKSCRFLFDWGPTLRSTSYNHVNPKVKAKWTLEYSYGPLKIMGQSWIIDVDEKYKWVVFASPDRSSLWILSRFKFVNIDTLDLIFERLKKRGFDITKIVFIDQSCQTPNQTTNMQMRTHANVVRLHENPPVFIHY